MNLIGRLAHHIRQPLHIIYRKYAPQPVSPATPPLPKPQGERMIGEDDTPDTRDTP